MPYSGRKRWCTRRTAAERTANEEARMAVGVSNDAAPAVLSYGVAARQFTTPSTQRRAMPAAAVSPPSIAPRGRWHNAAYAPRTRYGHRNNRCPLPRARKRRDIAPAVAGAVFRRTFTSAVQIQRRLNAVAEYARMSWSMLNRQLSAAQTLSLQNKRSAATKHCSLDSFILSPLTLPAYAGTAKARRQPRRQLTAGCRHAMSSIGMMPTLPLSSR